MISALIMSMIRGCTLIMGSSMFLESFQYFTIEIEPYRKRRMLFQHCHNAQRLAVVFKGRVVIMHPLVQCLLTRMSKGRMSQIMCKGYTLRQVFVESQRPRNIAADLC